MLADVLLLVLAIVIVGIWLTVAVAHLGDRTQLDHVCGEWLGLAYYAANGTFYPPVYDSGYYAGTRFGPVPILLHGKLNALLGDPIRSGKLLSIFGVACLIAASFLLLKRLQCPTGLAAMASSYVLLTDVGWFAGTSIRNDALAVGTQLAALAAGCRAAGGRWLAPLLAGALCALAFFVKASAVWATVALFLWFAIYHRRGLFAFVASGILSGVLLAGFFQGYSQGRYVENYRAFLFAGEGGSSFVSGGRLAAAEKTIVFDLATSATAVWALAPLALLAVIAGRRGPERSLLLVALVLSGLVTVLIFTNPGIAANHLIDLLALTSVLAAWSGSGAFQPPLVSEGAPPPAPAQPLTEAGRILRPLVVGAFFWFGLTALQVRGYLGEWRSAVDLLRGAATVGPEADPSSWREVIAPTDVVLADDATVPVLMGQRPVVLHSFMLKRYLDSHPAARDEFIQRIDKREFDRILTVVPLRAPFGNAGTVYADVHWGHAVVDALERNYRPCGKLWYYTVYCRADTPKRDN
jgi:hypothetical protein